jgi:hypothetical protein
VFHGRDMPGVYGEGAVVLHREHRAVREPVSRQPAARKNRAALTPAPELPNASWSRTTAGSATLSNRGGQAGPALDCDRVGNYS